MRLALTICVVAAAVGLSAAAPLPAHAASDETARIDALLAAVRASNVTFIRNEKAHTVAAAADHLKMKWERAGDRVRTAEEFIDKVGSRSSTSGKPYEVVLPDGTRRETGPWLRELLDTVDARRRPR